MLVCVKTEGRNRCRHIKVSVHVRHGQRVVRRPTEEVEGVFNVVLLCRQKQLLWHILSNISMTDGVQNISYNGVSFL